MSGEYKNIFSLFTQFAIFYKHSLELRRIKE
jgi:hypothetical protein